MTKIEYLLNILTKDEIDIWSEIKDLCIEANIDLRRHFIFKSTCGLNYTLEKIILDLFLKSKENPTLIFKFKVILICSEGYPDIFDLNTQYSNISEKEKIQALSNIEKVRTTLINRIKPLLNENDILIENKPRKILWKTSP